VESQKLAANREEAGAKAGTLDRAGVEGQGGKKSRKRRRKRLKRKRTRAILKTRSPVSYVHLREF
jgi:hypothetical protein